MQETNTVSRKEYESFIKSKLASDKSWATHALTELVKRQTPDEVASLETKESNFQGFSKFDAEILTSFANQYQRYGHLTAKQMVVLHKRIQHYWRQVLEMCDKSKLETMIKKG